MSLAGLQLPGEGWLPQRALSEDPTHEAERGPCKVGRGRTASAGKMNGPWELSLQAAPLLPFQLWIALSSFPAWWRSRLWGPGQRWKALRQSVPLGWGLTALLPA